MREIQKESTLCFVAVITDQVAGKLERGRYMAVLNLFHFHEFFDSIPLKTWNVSLKISSDFKHCPWLEVDSVIDLGHFVKSGMLSTLHRRDSLSQLSRISRKIIIETSLKHWTFVRKCQAIIYSKKGWYCTAQILRAWAFSNLESR